MAEAPLACVRGPSAQLLDHDLVEEQCCYCPSHRDHRLASNTDLEKVHAAYGLMQDVTVYAEEIMEPAVGLTILQI